MVIGVSNGVSNGVRDEDDMSYARFLLNPESPESGTSCCWSEKFGFLGPLKARKMPSPGPFFLTNYR